MKMAARAIKVSNGLSVVKRAINLVHVRAVSSKSVQQTLSSNPDRFSIKKTTILKQPGTLVVMFGFYGATDRALKSYCDLYQSFGFDVMPVQSYLKHFAWPKNSVKLAGDLLSHLKASCSSYDQIIIHAFSMGAYNFTICLKEMYEKPELYGEVQQNIKAIIYDSLSVGKLKNMATGVGQGVSQNKIVQTVIPLSVSLYLRLTYPWTVKFHNEAIKLFKEKPLQVPTLLFACENDTIAMYDAVEGLVDKWRKNFEFPLVFHSWEKSKHSAHLLVHREEYIQILTNFIHSVPSLMKQPELISKL